MPSNVKLNGLVININNSNLFTIFFKVYEKGSLEGGIDMTCVAHLYQNPSGM